MRPFMMFAPPTKLSPPGIPCNARAGLLKIVLATYGISTARPALIAKPLIVLSNFWAANFLSTVTATILAPALKGVVTTAATLDYGSSKTGNSTASIGGSRGSNTELSCIKNIFDSIVFGLTELSFFA